MRQWTCLFLLLMLLVLSGGCGGGEDSSFISELPPGHGGGGEPIVTGIVAGSLPGNNVDAYGYFDADVVMYSASDQEVPGLLLVLLGTPEDSGKEEILGSARVNYLQKGEHKYRFRMNGAAYNHEMDYLKTGRYSKSRLALIPGENFIEEPENMSVEINSTVLYTAAGELPVIVKDSIEVDVKDPPSHLGFSNANSLARNANGWMSVEAGTVNGEPVIVAYTATVDLKLELSCASYDVHAIEITENGGALLLGQGQNKPGKTLNWAGPFQSGEAGITFTAMYWGHDTPPDISTLSFSLRPIKAQTSELDDGKFTVTRATDETLRTQSVFSAFAAPEDALLGYEDFVSIVWHLWKAYELEPIEAGRTSEWDNAVSPAFWYAKLPRDLSKAVNWETAIAVYNGLSGVNMKSDFFYGDRPINMEDSNRNRNQFIRIPKVYYDAEQVYNSLYASSGSPFPFGDEVYLSWWCTLPTWMIRELIFPTPSRSYGQLTIGNAIGDDYLWQVAFPMFLKVASSYGVGSHEYALFYNEQLGLEQTDYPGIIPSRTQQEYKALFPQALAVPLDILEGNYSNYLEGIMDKKPVTFQYAPDYVRYYNDIEYSKYLGNGSTKLNAGFEFKYSDGVKYHINRSYPRLSYLTVHNWTTLDLDVPAWIFDHRFSIFEASVAFNSFISADAAYGADSKNLADLEWSDELTDESTTFHADLSLMGTTLFNRTVLFEMSDEEKNIIKDHPTESYPLISKAFEKPLISPDQASVVVGPVKIGFGFGILGEAGISVNYMYGKMTPISDTTYTKNSHIVGVRMELEPYGQIGAFAEVTVGLPITPPAPPVGLALRGEVTIIRLGLPFYYEREMGFAAEKMEMGVEGPIPSPNGDIYYTLRNRGEYGMDLTLGGLDGNLKLKVDAALFSREFEIYQWSGIDYIDDVNIFKFGQFLPLALPVVDSAP